MLVQLEAVAQLVGATGYLQGSAQCHGPSFRGEIGHMAEPCREGYRDQPFVQFVYVDGDHPADLRGQAVGPGDHFLAVRPPFGPGDQDGQAPGRRPLRPESPHELPGREGDRLPGERADGGPALRVDVEMDPVMPGIVHGAFDESAHSLLGQVGPGSGAEGADEQPEVVTGPRVAGDVDQRSRVRTEPSIDGTEDRSRRGARGPVRRCHGLPLTLPGQDQVGGTPIDDRPDAGGWYVDRPAGQVGQFLDRVEEGRIPGRPEGVAGEDLQGCRGVVQLPDGRDLAGHPIGGGGNPAPVQAQPDEGAVGPGSNENRHPAGPVGQQVQTGRGHQGRGQALQGADDHGQVHRPENSFVIGQVLLLAPPAGGQHQLPARRQIGRGHQAHRVAVDDGSGSGAR